MGLVQLDGLSQGLSSMNPSGGGCPLTPTMSLRSFNFSSPTLKGIQLGGLLASIDPAAIRRLNQRWSLRRLPSRQKLLLSLLLMLVAAGLFLYRRAGTAVPATCDDPELCGAHRHAGPVQQFMEMVNVGKHVHIFGEKEGAEVEGENVEESPDEGRTDNPEDGAAEEMDSSIMQNKNSLEQVRNSQERDVPSPSGAYTQVPANPPAKQNLQKRSANPTQRQTAAKPNAQVRTQGAVANGTQQRQPPTGQLAGARQAPGVQMGARQAPGVQMGARQAPGAQMGARQAPGAQTGGQEAKKGTAWNLSGHPSKRIPPGVNPNRYKKRDL